MPAEAVDRCRVVTVGYDRPEWFCEFYASGPIEFTAAGVSGWRIDRLYYQRNDGTLKFCKLAGTDAVDSGTPPYDVQRGIVNALEGWRIRVQVLASVDRNPNLPPPYNVRAYRNGAVDVVPADVKLPEPTLCNPKPPKKS